MDGQLATRAGYDYGALSVEVRTRVQERTEEIRVLVRRSAEDIVQIGQKLIEQKDELPHGEFTPWLEAEFEMTPRTARRFMSVAETFKTDTVSVLDADAKALYLLAGNGVFKRAMNRHLECCLPLVEQRIAGLEPFEPYVRLVGEPLPARALHLLLADARRRAWARPAEAMYHLLRDGGRLRMVYPKQEATAARIVYAGGENPAIVCELHSHCQLGAYFSQTDDGDELGFRFYAVIGKIFTRPEITMRLGVHGDLWPVPVETLFDGLGPFRETTTWRYGNDTW